MTSKARPNDAKSPRILECDYLCKFFELAHKAEHGEHQRVKGFPTVRDSTRNSRAKWFESIFISGLAVGLGWPPNRCVLRTSTAAGGRPAKMRRAA
jgi:hypothetical protein